MRYTDRLKTRIADLEKRVKQLESEKRTLEDERDDLQDQVDSALSETCGLQNDVERLECQVAAARGILEPFVAELEASMDNSPELLFDLAQARGALDS